MSVPNIVCGGMSGTCMVGCACLSCIVADSYYVCGYVNNEASLLFSVI